MTKDIPEAIRVHLVDFKRCKERVNTCLGGSQSIQELFHGVQPHKALHSIDSEHEYMRKISEILIELLLPARERELDSEIIRFLLREILSETVLVSLVEKLSDPDTIHQIILNSIPEDGGVAVSNYPLNASNASQSPQDSIQLSNTNSALDIQQQQQNGNTIGSLPNSKNDLSTPLLGDSSKPTLFHLKSQQPTTFLKRRKQSFSQNFTQKPSNITSSIVTGINKITFGGIDKMSVGLDKIKTAIKNPKEAFDNSIETIQRKSRSVKKFTGSKRSGSGNKGESQSPSKDKRRMSFKIGKSKVEKEKMTFGDNMTRNMVPRTEVFKKASKDSDVESEVDNLSDSALDILRGNEIASSSSHFHHRRLKSDDYHVTQSDSPDEISKSSTLLSKDLAKISDGEGEEYVVSDTESFVSHSSLLQMESEGILQDKNHHQDEKDMNNPLVTPHPIISSNYSLYDFWKMMLFLYSEARLGPSKIGILDVSQFTFCQLEDSFIDLFDEIFDLSHRFEWIWIQTLFLIRPVINLMARPILNRLIFE